MSFHVIFSPGLKFLGRKILAVEVSSQISDEFNCLTCRVDIILVVLPWHLYNNLLIICYINSRLKLSINHIVIEKYCTDESTLPLHRSSPREVFLGKVVMKICSKFPGEHPCRSVISIKLAFIKVGIKANQLRVPRSKQ